VAVALPLVIAGPVTAAWWRYHNARMPLLDAGVAVGADGVARGLGPDAGPDALLPGSRVLRTAPGDAGSAGRADPADAAALRGLAERERAWLGSGSVPGRGTPWGDTVRDALLDLRALTRLGPGTGTSTGDRPGAVVASWQPSWRYVWPRDAAFAAAAFARTGHTGDAVTVLGFLQSVQGADGTFQARYRPDGSGPPDARGVQLDGTGWALWATAQVAGSLPPARRAAVLAGLRPLVERSSDAAVRLTARGLPPVSRDYWELPEDRPTLGTAAPLAAGLAAAGPLLAELGDGTRRTAVEAAARRLDGAIRDRFGAGYPRHPGGSDRDASVAFLLPPFADATRPPDPGVVAAFDAANDELRQPAGGIAPGGAGWRDDGVAWTPETAVFALAAAAAGDRDRAASLLTWLSRHRTAVGTLPEKVRSDGRPAGPAPLAWSAAATVLAAAELESPGRL
jgi:GH15 family glucan-1,4-alpha-glucosidase